MPNILIWIILTFFLLITPKTALAEWNGLSTAGPDFLNSDDGKSWTYEIGNDGTVYKGGEQVKLAFGAYWCGSSNAASCDGDSNDYKNVSTLQSFTITAPVAGASTDSATKTFNISATDYPCGRVQADIVPDPNPNGDIIGGHIYDTGTTCPPAAPTNLSASCTAGTGTFSWTSGSGATEDTLRIDYNPVSWSNNCAALNSNDYCFGPPASPGNVNNMASGIYDWWVDSCNPNGCKTKHGPTYLTCPAVCTTSITAPSLISPDNNALVSPASVRLTWQVVTNANRYQVRVTDNTTGTVVVNNQRTANLFYDVSIIAAHSYTWGVKAIKDAAGSCGEVLSSESTGNFKVISPDIAVTCSANITSAQIGTNVTWEARVQNGVPPYTYSWSGDSPLQGKIGNPISLSYSTVGTKIGSVRVTDGSGTQTPLTACINSVTITAADLIVDSLSPASAVAGSSVSFSGRVRNTGTSSAGASSTRLRYDSNRDSTLDTTLTNQPTGTLAAGGSETETWPAVTFSTAGSYAFEICADIGEAVAESSDTNNCTTATLIINPAGTPTAPTVSTSLTCINPGYTGSGFTVTYGSRTPAVTWADIDTQSSFAEPYYHKGVTGTTSTTAPNGFNNFCTSGNCTGSLSLNPDTSYYVRVSNGSQNSLVANFSIPTCTAQPDLTVDSLSPTSAVAGNSVTFSGRVLNSVAAGASSARLRFASIAGGSLDTTPANQPVAALAAGGAQTVTWTSVWTATGAGNHSYEICADTPANAVSESSELNNCTTGNINVTSTSAPPAYPWIQIRGDVHTNTGFK